MNESAVLGPRPRPMLLELKISNLLLPSPLLLLLLSPLPSFLSLCFPLSFRSPPPLASSSSFAQQQNKLAHSTMPILVHVTIGHNPPVPAILLPTVLGDSLLLLLPPCFYIAKCNKRECCCIWLSGPGFQDLDRQTDATSEIIYMIY